jgi:multidrug resistance protein MdtO
MAGASAAAGVLKPIGTFFTEELAPRPGRLAASLRTAACCCLVTAIAMVFQTPGASESVFFVFVFSREDVVASVVAGLATTVTLTFALVLALIPATFDGGTIALRFPIMVAATLAAMYAARAFKVGAAGLVAGYVLVKVQTLFDTVPSTEAFVHAALWLWVIIELPVAVVVLVQLAMGESPAARARRSGVTALRTLADSLRHPASEDLREQHAEAMQLLTATRRVAMVDATAKQQLDGNVRLIETLETILAMRAVLPAETPVAVRERLAEECAACADAFEHKTPIPPLAEPVTDEPALTSTPAGVRPVVFALARALERLRDGLDRRSRGLGAPVDHVARPPRLTDAGERRDNLRFAVKATIAAMSAYLIYTGYDYSGISTALTTCFFVSLGSLGESVRKLSMRITGALIGGVLGGLCIAFLQPSMTDIGQLSLLVGAVTGICTWMAASARLSYLAWQIAFAFLLGTVQGYGPPSHFKELLNRVVGILLGNVLVTIVFSTLWPTSARARAEASIVEGLRELAGLLGAGQHPAGARLAALQSIDKARGFDAAARFELRMVPEAERAEARRGTSIDDLQRFAGLTFVVADSPGSPAVAGQLRDANDRSAKLLLARARPAEPAPEVGARAPAAVPKDAALSDRAAVEASALLSSELENAHAVAS